MYLTRRQKANSEHGALNFNGQQKQTDTQTVITMLQDTNQTQTDSLPHSETNQETNQ